jgi:uncharacterized oxidoreductase
MATTDPDALREFAAALLADLGAPDDTAETVASSLVGADLRGHTSHGVLRIPTYAEMIDDGVLVPDASPEVVRDHGNTAVVDGRGAFGQVVGRRAVETLVERASKRGLAGVGIRNGTHVGRVGEWAERVADEELLFASFVHTSGGGLVVAPAGSTTRRFSTNPLTYAVPSFGVLPFPFVLDMATSQVAHGKIDDYESRGKSIPGEWVVTPEGDPLTDPTEMGDFREGEDWGVIRPLGGTTSGYKGTGLATMAELFAGLLGGGPVAGQRDPEDWFSNGAFFLAVDPAAFGDRERMVRQVEDFVTHFRGADSHPDVPVGAGASDEEVLLPGEAEHRTAETNREEGVPVPDRVVEELAGMAGNRGVQHPFTGG